MKGLGKRKITIYIKHSLDKCSYFAKSDRILKDFLKFKYIDLKIDSTERATDKIKIFSPFLCSQILSEVRTINIFLRTTFDRS